VRPPTEAKKKGPLSRGALKGFQVLGTNQHNYCDCGVWQSIDKGSVGLVTNVGCVNHVSTKIFRPAAGKEIAYLSASSRREWPSRLKTGKVVFGDDNLVPIGSDCRMHNRDAPCPMVDSLPVFLSLARTAKHFITSSKSKPVLKRLTVCSRVVLAE
jgi:hypothetical protein